VTDETEQRARPRRVPRTARGEAAQLRRAEMRAAARTRLIESRLTPNAISVTGFLLNVVAAVLLLEHYFVLSGAAFIVGSLMDMFDGRYARTSGKGTPFGAFLDSTLDRAMEGLVLAAVAAYFAESGNELAVGATVLAVIGSYMVSYTRARAEALGVECKVGFATRAVRVVILSAGLVFASGAGLADFELLEPAIYVLAALTIFTTFQRVFHVRKQLLRVDAV
jgi:CDP-diacylglycerol---glycerol-3-phosphate 3-phosphatidyltransferase